MKQPGAESIRQTITLEELAETLGIGRSTAYQLAAEDQLPVPVICVGRRKVVARKAVDALLTAGQSQMTNQSADSVKEAEVE